MVKKTTVPELLAPAGSFDCLVAAIAAGADAVYVGGKRFGARAFAQNFDTDALSRAVSLCHLFGVKLYVTVNTLVTDREMQDALDYVRELYIMGVDAVIVADLGLVREIRRAVPSMEIHGSTQMSVHNLAGAEEAYSLGIKRVVLARELSAEDIKEITEKSKCEIEVFLHGALCVSHSGQCLFSSLVGGRSGNRGECAQPCRLPYFSTRGKGYPLSLKDLSLADHVPSLIESGVCSLKIEGRMKSKGYVYTVTQIYRRLLDEGRAATDDEKEILRRAFSRDGFTSGYYEGKLSGMTGVRSEQDKEDGRGLLVPDLDTLRRRVQARCSIKAGEAATLTLYNEEREITVRGDVPQVAISAPLLSEEVKERLSKMGNTFLSLYKSDIDLELSDGVNLSPSSINSLRREAAAAFMDFSRKDIPSLYKYEPTRTEGAEISTAQFFDERAFMSADVDGKIDASFVALFASDEAVLRAGGVFIPPVVMENEYGEVRERLAGVRRLGVTRVMVDNIGHIGMARELGFEIFGGFRLNIYNSAAREELSRLGVKEALVSPELTLPQARDIGGGVIVYGRIPLMLTERCFIKENFGCDRCSEASFVDRMGEKFPLIREYKHRNLILNSGITYMGDRKDELSKNRIKHTHLLFTIDNDREIEAALAAIESGESLGQGVRRVGRRDARPRTQVAESFGAAKNKENAMAQVSHRDRTDKGRGVATSKKTRTGVIGGKSESRRSVDKNKKSNKGRSATTNPKRKGNK